MLAGNVFRKRKMSSAVNLGLLQGDAGVNEDE